MSNMAIKYRIYPNKKQDVLFTKTFGCCRKVYNLMLSDRVENYKLTGRFEGRSPAGFKKLDEYSYLKEVDSLALANVWTNLNSAFHSCFDKKRKKKNKFPKFKSKKRSRLSYTTFNQHGTVNLDADDNTIRLPKIGKVKAVLHRLPGEGWQLKSATISKDPDGCYYASILFEYEEVPVAYTPDMSNAIGLDYSSPNLYVDSNGNIGTNHKYFKENYKKLAKQQRKLSKKAGNKKFEAKSKNFYKQLRKVNKIHSKIKHQRIDNLHKLSAGIVNRYDVVCVENLNMKAMSNKAFKNGRSTMDNGYGLFLNLLSYKLAAKGKLLIKVDRWFPSSQLCSCCGNRNTDVKDLSIRKWACPACGVIHDRDVNAAVNILNEGLRTLTA